MKKLLVVLLHLATLSSFGWEFSEGTYEAKIDSKNDAYLMLKKIPGREGSFMATLMHLEKDQITALSVYAMDEMKGGAYALTPITLVDNGELGISNDNPSIVVIKDREDNKFTITSSQSGNVLGIQASYSFGEGRSPRFDWHLSIGGDYGFDKKEDSQTIAAVAVSTNDIENDVVMTDSNVNGIFKLRQKLNYLYALNSNKLMATGYEREVVPSLMSIFVQENRKKGFSKKWAKKNTLLIFINPGNDTGHSVLVKR